MRMIELPRTPAGHAAPVTHVAFRPDGRRLATCSYDGTVIVWDTGDPTRPTRLAHLLHRRLVNAAAWNPADATLLASASADKTAVVWRVAEDGTSAIVTVLARHTDDVNAVAWLPDGARLICVSEDGRATLWNALTGEFAGEIGAHTAHCMMVSVSRHGLVATVGEDGLVCVTDPDGGRDAALRHYPASIEGCCFSHDGDTLAVTRDDGHVELLTAELAPLATLHVSDSAARSVAWSADDALLAVGAYEGGLRFFSRSGAPAGQVVDPRLWPRSVASAGDLLAAGSFWGAPHLLRFADGQRLFEPAEPTHGPNALARRGADLLVGCDSGTVATLAADAAKAAGPVMPVTDGPVLSLAACQDRVYAGTYAGRVISFSGETWDTERTISEPLGAPVPSLCTDGDTLVAGTYNGDLIRLDPRTLAVLDRRRAHEGSVKSVVPLPGGGFLSAATDRSVACGDLAERGTLWQHGNLVNAVAQLDGAVVASASRDHTVKVGRLTGTGTARRATDVQTLLGPDESVKCVALLGTPAAPVVLAGSYDFGLYAWEVDWSDSAGTLASGRLLDEFGQGLSCMLPLDDGRAAVAGWDGRIAVVGVQPGAAGPGRIEVLHSVRLDDAFAVPA